MKDWIKDIGVAVVVAVIILQFVEPSRVYGTSMLPNFAAKDYVILSKLAYEHEKPKRNDIVVFESKLVDDKGKDKNLIKRVIGLPGERVTISNGCVYIDGVQLDDSYTKDKTTNGELDIVVPDGEVFCMGDNRLHSTDSRYSDVGCVPIDEILGKVVFRLYPLSKFGTI